MKTDWYPVDDIYSMGPFGIETARNRSRTYDPASGRVLTIKSPGVQDFTYTWRTNGSLETRTNATSGTPIVDSFNYDIHDRLVTTTTKVNNVTQRSLTQGYNNLGNLNTNTSTNGTDAQVTGYQYGTTTNAGPHAVSVAVINGVSNTLYYDKNGAITQYDAASGSDKFIAYNSINQPTKITVGASLDDVSALARDEFKYTPDGERYYKKSSYLENGVQRVEHTFYVGDYEATIYDTQSPTYKSEKYTFGDFVHIRKTPYVGSPTEAQLYLYRDHQGSVDATVGAGSTTLFAFEPFGARRNSNTLSGNITAAQLSDILLKDDVLPYAGYTGHESLDRTGFIHMNGRVYDPQLARFLSPDPLVQAPTNSQNWNRYSYVFNNPLKYVDPTGYATETVCTTQHYEQESVTTCTVTTTPDALPSSSNRGGDSYADAFVNKWNERVDQVTTAADNAVDYWVEQDNVVMGTLAATLTEANIANTTITLASGGVGGGLAGIGRQAYVNSMKNLSAFRARLIEKGYSEKAIARAMVAARNLVKDAFRGGIKIDYHRPSYNQLRATKTDAQIIQGATKTNDGVNRMLGAK